MTPGLAALDPAAAALLARLRPASAPALRELPLAKARAYADALPTLLGEGPAVGLVRDQTAHGVPVRVYEHPECDDAGTIVYLHGGGWVLGGIANDDALVRMLVLAAGCRVVSVGYRLAPEHPFPAGLEDAEAALRWTAEQFAGPVMLVGESAGGNLAAVLARLHPGRVEAQVLVCPVVDHVPTPSYANPGVAGLLSPEDLAWFWEQYVPDPAAREDARAAPLRADDLSGVPRALVLTAGHDPLRDEGAAYAARLADSGVPVHHEHRGDLMHGFLPLAPLLPAAADVLGGIGAFARSALRLQVTR